MVAARFFLGTLADRPGIVLDHRPTGVVLSPAVAGPKLMCILTLYCVRRTSTLRLLEGSFGGMQVSPRPAWVVQLLVPAF